MTPSLQMEQTSFRTMIWISLLFHFLLALFVLIGTYIRPRPLFKIESPKSMNVMWAETVSLGNPTPAYKLPGPIFKGLPIPEKIIEKPKILLPKEPTQRRKELSSLVKQLDSSKEDRPIPRADNFPSEGKKKGLGLPASPMGGEGNLTQNPEWMGYKQSLQKKITDQFLWLHKTISLKAEVSFRMDLQGNIMEASVSKSSGNTSYDQAALRAVHRSSPLPPPPPSLAKNFTSEIFVIVFDPK